MGLLVSSASASFVVRWVHVLGMVVVVGGSASLCIMLLSNRGEGEPVWESARLRAAMGYEWAFWAAIGVLVLTGVGNAGAFAGHLPTPETVWGWKFVAKLFGVLGLIVVSFLRTCLVAQWGRGQGPRFGHPAPHMIGGAYAATVFLAVAILSMALSLAHG